MNRQQKCLGCYQALDQDRQAENYHKACSKKLFGTENPPIVDFGIEQLEELAKSSLNNLLGVTGVQPKISLDLKKHKDDPKHRLMIVGLWGNFI